MDEFANSRFYGLTEQVRAARRGRQMEEYDARPFVRKKRNLLLCSHAIAVCIYVFFSTARQLPAHWPRNLASVTWHQQLKTIEVDTDCYSLKRYTSPRLPPVTCCLLLTVDHTRRTLCSPRVTLFARTTSVPPIDIIGAPLKPARELGADKCTIYNQVSLLMS
jgi:hypothetical protein